MTADPESQPAVHQTHTGMVVLVGDRAYKTKRAVVTDFLDFSTVALREEALARELELNSRLSPQAYLGLAHLEGPGADEREPVLVMRRYPDSARLSSRVKAGVDVSGDLRDVARILAEFHTRGRRGLDVDVHGRVPAVTARWEDNLDEMAPFADDVVPRDTLKRVRELATQFIAGRAVLFADRISLRRIVDGHADLLADDVFCLDSGPVLLDCLDFDERLRCVDGLDDAAFLAMDLEFLGRPDLAELFLDEYCRQAADPAPEALRHFCIAYRAVVRAKVDCIRVSQGVAEARADAVRHLDLAVGHLRAAVPKVILVGGGPGTGKTTLARSLAEQIGAEVISTDDVRRDLVRDGVISGEPGRLEAGLYTPENTARVYTVVRRRAHSVLASGGSVILDGTWRAEPERERVRELAQTAHAALVELACTTPLREAQARIETRTGSTSDATPEIAAAMEHRAGAWPGAYVIDTARPIADSVAEAQEVCCLAI
jgi:aminoglycoside phosphotransferase family enzyme/predicted kinase